MRLTSIKEEEKEEEEEEHVEEGRSSDGLAHIQETYKTEENKTEKELQKRRRLNRIKLLEMIMSSFLPHFTLPKAVCV